MGNLIKLLADMPSPFPIIQPGPENQLGLWPYVIGALIVIGGVTVMVVLFARPKNNSIEKKKIK